MFFALLIYYQLDYKRHFISNTDKTKYFTIWCRYGNNCYIVPGKYYGVFPPSNNYIKTVNYRNYIGVIWDTKDNYQFKLSIYNDFEENNLNPNIKTYNSNDSLLLEYNILETFDLNRGKRIKNPDSETLKKKFDYNYIDLNRIFGIKIYDYE